VKKRIFDVILSLSGLIVSSPLILFIFVVLFLFQKKPIFFVQERIGRYGRPFNIYKFRSMRIVSEQNEMPRLTIYNDSRQTPIGKFLRKHHLDELPQLWNVLKGDMSIVGPRPEQQYYIEKIIEHNPRYVELYQVRPGLTSYASLYNGYTDTMDKMLRRLDMDLDYLEHQSVWTDMVIMAKTVKIMIKGD